MNSRGTNKHVEINKQLPIGAHSNSGPKQDKIESDFKTWDKHLVGNWLISNDFGEYKEAFVRNDITGNVLLNLDYNSLKDVGVLIVGDRARILQAIRKAFAAPVIRPLQQPREMASDAISPKSHSKSFGDPEEKPRRIVSFAVQKESSQGSTQSIPVIKSETLLRSNSSKTAQPLVIFPRSSSFKGPQKSTVHKDLYEAMDTVFGGSPSMPLTPLTINTQQKHERSRDSPPIMSLEDIKNDDIMNVKTVREVFFIN
jgi:hypothetical protein